MAVLLKAVHLTLRPKISFLDFFVSEKGLASICKKAVYTLFFQFLIFALLWAEIEILAELRLPNMIRKVKFTNFVKGATCSFHKIQLTEFRFHTNSEVLSLLWLTKYGNVLENTKLTSKAGRRPLRPLFILVKLS